MLKERVLHNHYSLECTEASSAEWDGQFLQMFLVCTGTTKLVRTECWVDSVGSFWEGIDVRIICTELGPDYPKDREQYHLWLNRIKCDMQEWSANHAVLSGYQWLNHSFCRPPILHLLLIHPINLTFNLLTTLLPTPWGQQNPHKRSSTSFPPINHRADGAPGSTDFCNLTTGPENLCSYPGSVLLWVTSSHAFLLSPESPPLSVTHPCPRAFYLY